MTKPLSIFNDSPFQVSKRAFSIGKSATGYTLKHNPSYIEGSTIVESDWEVYDPAGGNGQVAAGASAVVECPANDVFRLYGNTGEVLIRF